MQLELTLKAKDYKTEIKPIWCPRCGDYGFLSALYKTFEDFQSRPHETVVVSGIGCAGRIPAFINAYGFHGVHGRVLPIAMGIKLANPALRVIAVGGDGDAFAIGIGHFPHAIRRNIDMIYVVLDNSLYGLTKGQSSPTTHVHHLTPTNPFGIEEEPLDPVSLAISQGAGFVARIFTGDMRQMREILPRAFAYKGFAFIHALSPCSTFYDTFDYYQEIVKPLPAELDVHSKLLAYEYAESTQPLYTGIFRNVEKETLEQKYRKLVDRQFRADRTILDVARSFSKE